MSNQNEGKKAEKTGSVDRMLETKTIHDDREIRKKQRHSEMRARFEALQSIEGNRGQERVRQSGLLLSHTERTDDWVTAECCRSK